MLPTSALENRKHLPSKLAQYDSPQLIERNSLFSFSSLTPFICNTGKKQMSCQPLFLLIFHNPCFTSLNSPSGARRLAYHITSFYSLLGTILLTLCLLLNRFLSLLPSSTCDPISHIFLRLWTNLPGHPSRTYSDVPMFRRLSSGLPKDPIYPHTLEGLGSAHVSLTLHLTDNYSYFINDKDEIRSVENPKAYFKFFLTKNVRYNILQREAMNGQFSPFSPATHLP